MTVDHGGRASPVPRDARPYQGQPAGLVTRLVAAALDALVVGVILLGGYFGLCGLVFLVHGRGFSLPRLGPFVSLTSAFAVALVYLTVTWALGGRSYGYLVMGLRVVTRRERAVGLPIAAARAFLVLLVPIGVVWVPLGRGNRSLQDLVLGTRVVYDWQPRTPHLDTGG